MCVDDTDELALVLPEELLDDIIVNLCGSCIGSWTKGATKGVGAQVVGNIKWCTSLATMLHAVMLYELAMWSELAVWSGVANPGLGLTCDCVHKYVCTLIADRWDV